MIPRRSFLAGVLATSLTTACRSKDGASSADDDAPIGPLLDARVLAGRLDDVKAGKIAVFYVGPEMLFARGRVPGARKTGPINSAEGRRALTDALAQVPPTTEIVVYCGCCPVQSCPNLRPASAAVQALRRSNAHVLDLPTEFGMDWTGKGYPTERG